MNFVIADCQLPIANFNDLPASLHY